MVGAILTLCLGLAWALGSATAPARAGASSAACTQDPVPGTHRIYLDSGGLLRTALVHVPPAAAGRRLALLLALHGAGQSGASFEGYTGYSLLADGEGFVAVYPDATVVRSHSFWTINDDRPGAPDDVRFISDLIEQLQSTLCLDAARVYATGVSNGAGMVARLACELSDRLAAVAPVAGGYASQPPCHPTAPVSVLEIHGSADSAVPYDGGSKGAGGAARGFVAAWAARDRCRAGARTSRVADRVLRFAWTRCAEGTSVAHLEILGGGHQLPGALPPDRGQPSTISAPWAVWSFLRTHVQARPYPGQPPGVPVAAPPAGPPVPQLPPVAAGT